VTREALATPQRRKRNETRDSFKNRGRIPKRARSRKHDKGGLETLLWNKASLRNNGNRKTTASLTITVRKDSQFSKTLPPRRVLTEDHQRTGVKKGTPLMLTKRQRGEASKRDSRIRRQQDPRQGLLIKNLGRTGELKRGEVKVCDQVSLLIGD